MLFAQRQHFSRTLLQDKISKHYHHQKESLQKDSRMRWHERMASGLEQVQRLCSTGWRTLFVVREAWSSWTLTDRWLNSEVAALGGERPFDLFDSFEGRRWVTEVTKRLETGDFRITGTLMPEMKKPPGMAVFSPQAGHNLMHLQGESRDQKYALPAQSYQLVVWHRV